MNLLVYSTMPVIPMDYGGAVRIYNTVNKIAEHGVEVTLISPRPSSVNDVNEDQNINYIFYTPTVSKLFKRIKFFNKVKYFLNFFIFVEEFFLIKKILPSKLEKRKTILQSEYIYSVVPLYLLKKIYKIPLVITEHNVESEVSLEINNNKMYYKVLRFIETFFLNRCDQIICVSERDKKILQEQYKIPCDKISLGPNATNLPKITRSMSKKSLEIKKALNIDDDSKIVLFMGTLQYYPNKKAVEIIQNEINPLVKSHIEKVKFLIVGKGIDAKVEGNIIFTGLVEDVNPYIYMSDLAIAPLTQGGGTRLKILEYMSFSKSVVSTSKGAEGLEITNNENIIISDEWTDFSDSIVKLLQDKDKMDRIGNNGRKLVEDKYTWESTANTYLGLYNKLLND